MVCLSKDNCQGQYWDASARRRRATWRGQHLGDLGERRIADVPPVAAPVLQVLVREAELARRRLRRKALRGQVRPHARRRRACAARALISFRVFGLKFGLSSAQSAAWAGTAACAVPLSLRSQDLVLE